jgi:hypothetical protein
VKGFVKEFVLAPETKGAGSTWDAALSVDAADSKGNLYTTEVDTGKRAQRFVNHGVSR